MSTSPFEERYSGQSWSGWERDKNVDPRILATTDVFREALATQAENNTDVLVIACGEAAHQVTCRFAERCADRFLSLESGSREAGHRAVEAARKGSTVFVCVGDSMSVAALWPVLRDDICRGRLDVKLVAAAAGFSAHEDSPPPDILEDLALLRVLPRMTVVIPADADETKRVLRWSLETRGPAYIRLSSLPTRGVTKRLTHFEPGQADVINPGWDVALIASGPLVGVALDTAEELELDCVSARVLNFSTIKPMDRTAVVEAAIATRRIVTLEEHQIVGGLGSAVAEIIAQEGCGGRVRMMGLNNEFLADLPAKDLSRHYGLTVGRLVEVTKELIASVP
ncbi:MAG: transketolase C-terminal domain-containing protein [bacterium]